MTTSNDVQLALVMPSLLDVFAVVLAAGMFAGNSWNPSLAWTLAQQLLDAKPKGGTSPNAPKFSEEGFPP